MQLKTLLSHEAEKAEESENVIVAEDDTDPLKAPTEEVVEIVEIEDTMVSPIESPAEKNVRDDLELEVVHAIAHFENSPNRDITQDDVLSLEKFICSEDHLTRNIARIEIDLKPNLEATVRLHVRKKNLWETPKNYIWKFLGGENFWDRQNGTKIRMKRIHVKQLFPPQSYIGWFFFYKPLFDIYM